MKIERSRYISTTAVAGDFFLLNLFFVAGFVLVQDTVALTVGHIVFFLYLNLAWFLISAIFGLFSTQRAIDSLGIVRSYIQVVVFFFFAFLLYFQLQPLDYYARDFIKILFPVFFLSILVWQLSLFYGFFFLQKNRRRRQVIILGQSEMAQKLYRYIKQNPWLGYHCLGIIGGNETSSYPRLGTFSDLPSLFRQTIIEEIFVASADLTTPEKNTLAQWLNEFPVKVTLIPDLGNFSFQHIEIQHWGSIPLVALHPSPLSYRYNQWLKRVFDFLCSSLVIVSLLSWITPLLYLIDLFSSQQGVFFTQKRTSLNGKTFTIFKYRSMYINPDADKKQAVENDARITRLGAFLRKSNIDELPQFINVFLGQMSIVGPRPHMLEHTEQYRQVVQAYMLRHLVKPGITGLAQVNGYRGEVKQLEDIRRRVEMDLDYIRDWSFLLDLHIVIQTLFLVFKSLF